MLTATQRIRVEWSNCDPAGIIFNPYYYIWMDQGTHALLQAAGFDFVDEANTNKNFLGCPLVASNMEFKKPLRFGDVTTMSSRVRKFGNTSFVVAHEFCKTEELMAFGAEVRVWAARGAGGGGQLVARRVPDAVRQGLSENRTVDMSV